MPRGSRSAPIGLALAGGGPFGAIYEIGALLALEDCIEGLRLHRLDCYVGVSAGGFLAAALANGIPIRRIHALFIETRGDAGALSPRVFMRPALREFARRARTLPALVVRSAWAGLRAGSLLEAAAPLGRAIPTGLFDNASIDAYLAQVFSSPGRSNDFRKLRRPLYLVATDLDRGTSVTFGRPGNDHVPISQAVQASAALPGLFPPVEIEGRSYVDGALRKTLHASEALDDGAKLVLCVNPVVTFDVQAARGRTGRARLVDGGLPMVLSQTFRAVIQSRLAVGLSKYDNQYPGADVLLFQPDAHDSQTFFANPFGYATRARLCRHAYERTCADLARRREELAPVLARHGLALRARASSPARAAAIGPRAPESLLGAAESLRGSLEELREWIGERQATARAG